VLPACPEELTPPKKKLLKMMFILAPKVACSQDEDAHLAYQDFLESRKMQYLDFDRVAKARSCYIYVAVERGGIDFVPLDWRQEAIPEAEAYHADKDEVLNK